MKSSLEMFSCCHACWYSGAIESVKSCGDRPGGLGGLLHLLAVLVGAGEEVDVVAEQAVPASDGVADDGGVRVAEVRLGGDVVDGGGEEVVAHDGILSKNGERTAG